MDSNLRKRILFAAIAIPIALFVVWWGGWALAALVAVVSGLGCCEFYDLAVLQGVRPLKWTGCILAALTPLLFQAILGVPTDRASGMDLVVAAFGLLALVTLLILTLSLFRRSVADKPLSSAGVTLFGIAYTAVLPSFVLLIRADQPNRSWVGTSLVFFPLLVTWVSDTAAMFGGRAFGKVKLAPIISPNKTRAGAIAGVIGGVVVAVVFALLVFSHLDYNGCGGGDLGLGAAILMGVVLSIVGQIGDLVESLLKREAGVKDSSTLIPGHGGVLDRFDSLYFVIPIAALCYSLLLFGHAC